MLPIRPPRQKPVHGGGTRLPSTSPNGSGWWGFVLVAIGWSGIGLLHWVAGSTPEPSSRTVVMAAVALAVVSLASVAGGIALAYNASRSPLHHVFRSQALFRTAAIFSTVATIALGSLIARSPFDGIAAHGKPLAELLGDLSFVFASLTCAGGGIATLHEGWKARRDERTWGR
jgi:hypothetical protein